MATIYRESIFELLGITSSNSSPAMGKAKLAHSVIAGDFTKDFSLEGSITASANGLFFTVNDLAKFGIGILNSTLFSADLTQE